MQRRMSEQVEAAVAAAVVTQRAATKHIHRPAADEPDSDDEPPPAGETKRKSTRRPAGSKDHGGGGGGDGGSGGGGSGSGHRRDDGRRERPHPNTPHSDSGSGDVPTSDSAEEGDERRPTKSGRSRESTRSSKGSPPSVQTGRQKPTRTPVELSPRHRPTPVTPSATSETLTTAPVDDLGAAATAEAGLRTLETELLQQQLAEARGEIASLKGQLHESLQVRLSVKWCLSGIVSPTLRADEVSLCHGYSQKPGRCGLGLASTAAIPRSGHPARAVSGAQCCHRRRHETNATLVSAGDRQPAPSLDHRPTRTTLVPLHAPAATRCVVLPAMDLAVTSAAPRDRRDGKHVTGHGGRGRWRTRDVIATQPAKMMGGMLCFCQDLYR